MKIHTSLSRVFFGLCRFAHEVLDRIVPRGGWICFLSYPDVDDNALSLFEAHVRRGDDPSRMVWLASDVRLARKRLTERNHIRSRAYSKNSLIGYWVFLRSKRVYFTHGHYKFVRPSLQSGSRLVNLWHGMPIKAIARLDGDGAEIVQASDVAIASSPFFQPIISRAFGIPIGRVLVTGLPRCDLLFRSAPEVNRFLVRIGAEQSRVVVWMPTYRVSVVGDIRVDSSLSRRELKRVFVSSLGELSHQAARVGCEVVVKLHPMDFLNQEQLPDVPHVHLLRSSSDFFNRISIYEMLAASDGLITDLSSVCIDYMATQKPILMVDSFRDEYVRGFAFDVSLLLSTVFTSRSIGGADEFFDGIASRCAARDSYRRFCAFMDPGSSERVLAALDGIGIMESA